MLHHCTRRLCPPYDSVPCSADQPRSSPISQEKVLDVRVRTDHEIAAKLVRDQAAQAILPICELPLIVIEHSLVDQKFNLMSGLFVDQSRLACNKVCRFE